MTPPRTPGSALPPPEIPNPRRNRRATAAGVTAGLLGGGVIGLLVAMPTFSSAASSDTTPPTTEVVVTDDSSTDATTADETTATTPADVPDATGTPDTSDAPDAPPAPPSNADRQAKAAERIRTELQNLVDDGTITAAQADAVAADLAAAVPDHGPGGRGGRGGPGGPGGFGGHHRPGFDGEVLAGLLGIDADTLRSDLRDGKTIAQIAGEHGVDVQTVIDSFVAETKSHLDLAVQNGRLTQDEADAKLAEATERITDFVNNGFPQRGPDQPTT